MPMTAWEQAAIVALFATVFLAVLGYLTKWFSTQQKDWQAFMKQMNDEWRSWLDDANGRESDALQKVTEALDRLSGKLDEHDAKVDDRINRAMTTITKRGGRSQ